VVFYGDVKMMLTLTVSGMTCGGCIQAITRALQVQDPAAAVEADLASQTVTVQSCLSPELTRQIIGDAGFPVIN
jgi:copper chaperone